MKYIFEMTTNGYKVFHSLALEITLRTPQVTHAKASTFHILLTTNALQLN